MAFLIQFKNCPLLTVAMEPDCQIALSENLKKVSAQCLLLRIPPSPLLEFHLGRNQLPGWRLPCLDLSQYLGGELFLNLHLNFTISTLSSIPSADQLVFGVPLPLRSFLLTRSKRQRLLQSNLGQSLHSAQPSQMHEINNQKVYRDGSN